MVDAVDGVDVCLAAPIKDDPRYTSLDLPAGRSTIRGGMALSFVRARHVGTDFGRMQRQQQFMASLLKKAMSLGIVTNPFKLDGFVSAAAESLQVDETLGRDELLSLARRLAGVQLDQIEFARLPIANDNYTDPDTGTSGYVTWGSGSQHIFDAIINDRPLVVGKKAPTPGASPTGPVLTTDPMSIEVRVLNGSGVSGLGAKAATALSGAGFTVVAPAASSSRSPSTRTVIRYDSTYTESVKTMAAALPGAVLEPVDGFGRVFEITVGSGYTGVVTPVVTPTATSTPDPSDISAPQPPVLASTTVCK
jgi:hypothetical protein